MAIAQEAPRTDVSTIRVNRSDKIGDSNTNGEKTTPIVIEPDSNEAAISLTQRNRRNGAPKQTRVSEAQRIAELKNDARVGYFDDAKVVCIRCKKVVRLTGKKYYLKNWRLHREICIIK